MALQVMINVTVFVPPSALYCSAVPTNFAHCWLESSCLIPQLNNSALLEFSIVFGSYICLACFIFFYVFF